MKPTPTPTVTDEMVGRFAAVYYGGDVPHLMTDIRHALSAALSVQPAAAVVGEPVAWVVPGDDNAMPNGFIDAMAWKEGEFTRPLYAAPSAPDGWQPIETAPDEGVFLVWCGFVCFGYIGYHHGEKRWYDSDALECGNYIRVRPTHWRPLPSPPALGGKP